MGIGLEQQLRELCGRIDGEWGLSLYIPERGERLSVNAQARRVSASTIKIPLLALLLKDAEEGRLDLEQPVAIDAVNRVGGSGILQSLSPTVKLSLRDHAELMMVLSDNVSTNVVIDAVGMERANAFFVQEGWTATHLGRKMMTQGALLPDGTREQNYTSVADLADMMERVQAGTMVSPQVSRTMLRIMAGQRNGKFRPALPEAKRYDPSKELELPPEGRVVLAAKSGTLVDPVVANDAGILLLPDGRSAVLVMMTASRSNPETERIMGQVARTVYEALK
jgi:beta-lactamase class A